MIFSFIFLKIKFITFKNLFKKKILKTYIKINIKNIYQNHVLKTYIKIMY